MKYSKMKDLKLTTQRQSINELVTFSIKHTFQLQSFRRLSVEYLIKVHQIKEIGLHLEKVLGKPT